MCLSTVDRFRSSTFAIIWTVWSSDSRVYVAGETVTVVGMGDSQAIRPAIMTTTNLFVLFPFETRGTSAHF